MEAPLMSRMKELEDENWRLKKLYTKAQLAADIAKEVWAGPGFPDTWFKSDHA